MKKITIRAAEMSDVKTILNINMKLWVETYENKELGISAKELRDYRRVTDEKVEKLRKRIEKNKYPSWVAEVDGIVVGFVFPMKDEKAQNRVGALYVLSEYQRLGIGSMLIEKDLDYWSNHEGDVFLLVVEYNDRAIKFYKSHGFQFTDDPVEYIELPSGRKLPERKMILRR